MPIPIWYHLVQAVRSIFSLSKLAENSASVISVIRCAKCHWMWCCSRSCSHSWQTMRQRMKKPILKMAILTNQKHLQTLQTWISIVQGTCLQTFFYWSLLRKDAHTYNTFSWSGCLEREGVHWRDLKEEKNWFASVVESTSSIIADRKKLPGTRKTQSFWTWRE